MPSPFVKAGFRMLVGYAPVSSLLPASVNKPGEPGIYSQYPVPEHVKYPLIVFSGHVTDEEFDTKGDGQAISEGRDVSYDIRVVGVETGSVEVVDQLAELVRKAFHRVELPVIGYRHEYTRVSGPIASDEDGYYGRILTINSVYSGLLA